MSVIRTEGRDDGEQKCEPLHNNPSRARTGNMAITHVAIRFCGQIYSLPAPNRHHDVIRMIVAQTGVGSVDAREDDQGFLLDGERYCRRKPALRIALANGQCLPSALGVRLGKLFSEDLW
jgi:hypothetical protein